MENVKQYDQLSKLRITNINIIVTFEKQLTSDMMEWIITYPHKDFDFDYKTRTGVKRSDSREEKTFFHCIKCEMKNHDMIFKIKLHKNGLQIPVAIRGNDVQKTLNYIHYFLNILRYYYLLDDHINYHVSVKNFRIYNINCHTMIGYYKNVNDVQIGEKIMFDDISYDVVKRKDSTEGIGQTITAKSQKGSVIEVEGGVVFAGSPFDFPKLKQVIFQTYPELLCVYCTDKNSSKMSITNLKTNVREKCPTLILYRSGGLYFCGIKTITELYNLSEKFLDIMNNCNQTPIEEFDYKNCNIEDFID